MDELSIGEHVEDASDMLDDESAPGMVLLVMRVSFDVGPLVTLTAATWLMLSRTFRLSFMARAASTLFLDFGMMQVGEGCVTACLYVFGCICVVNM